MEQTSGGGKAEHGCVKCEKKNTRGFYPSGSVQVKVSTSCFQANHLQRPPALNMSPKRTRTIHIYDKGSNYLLLDSDDATPLYHVHWNSASLPHMIVSHVGSDESQKPIGAANFIPRKTGGFATADHVKLSINGHQTPLTKTAPSSLNQSSSFLKSLKQALSTDKRYFSTIRGTNLYWEGGVAASGFLKLIDLATGSTVATYKNTAYDGRRMGKIDIFVQPLSEEELDEIVISGMAMVSEQKGSMGQIAANMASAGGMSG